MLDADRVRERLQQGPGWLVAANAVPLGTVAVLRTPVGLYVRGMAVVPSARGCGIGAALLEEVERFAVDARAPRVFLSTTPFLKRAIALYERHGFVRSEEAPHALHGTPLFTMERSIRAA